MPDGSQPQPEDPAAQRAREQMREWKEKHQDPHAGGWLGNVISTVDGVLAAAEAGQFAVDPHTGAAIISRLTQIQDRVAEMRMTGSMAQLNGLRLGGGYATDVAAYSQQVTSDGVKDTLLNFTEELEKLKTAVSKSTGAYIGSDQEGKRQVDSSGEGL
jgi:hypothetical protein